MSCRGICVKYQFDDNKRNWGVYEEGIKRCPYCNKYLELADKNCPCCKNKLKLKVKRVTTKNQKHQNFIYRKFRLKLNLKKSVVDNAKTLEEDLMKKIQYNISPIVMATACIFSVTRLEQPRDLEEILDVYQIPEVELRYGMSKICEKIPDSP